VNGTAMPGNPELRKNSKKIAVSVHSKSVRSIELKNWLTFISEIGEEDMRRCNGSISRYVYPVGSYQSIQYSMRK
jgi:hypothetical protein